MISSCVVINQIPVNIIDLFGFFITLKMRPFPPPMAMVVQYLLNTSRITNKKTEHLFNTSVACLLKYPQLYCFSEFLERRSTIPISLVIRLKFFVVAITRSSWLEGNLISFINLKIFSCKILVQNYSHAVFQCVKKCQPCSQFFLIKKLQANKKH